MTQLILPIEIVQLIMNFVDYKTQIYMKTISKELYITNLDVSLSISKKITNEIISRYDKLLYLNLYGNKNVTNLSNLTNLIKLSISNSAIKYEYIRHLTCLEELNISNTMEIIDITNFPNVKELYIRGFTNINYNDLINLPKLENIYLVSNYYKKQIIEILNNKVKINN
jgi:hypothetical protein